MIDIDEFSLFELIQEVQRKTLAEPLPPDQHWLVLQMTADILHACAQGAAPPLPAHDIQEVRGQDHVKRALEVAAAGGHNILLLGPPGAGKNLLAQTFPSLLPHTPVPSPFRQPESTSERATFLGERPFPGELTLAHGGVLFLKELTSFDRSWLAAVRQASTTHLVTVGEIIYPAHFLLLATAQPCLCGFYGDPLRECTCSADAILSYSQRLQEDMEGCFDLQSEVPILREELRKMRPGEPSSAIRRRVEVARERQRERFAEVIHRRLWVNAEIQSVEEVQQYCVLDAPAERLLLAARQQLYLTPFQCLQIQKVARTIADLGNADSIAISHLAEAIQYRARF